MSAEQRFRTATGLDPAEFLELLGIAEILKEMHRMTVTVEGLRADFETFKATLTAKLAELRDAILAAHNGEIPPDVQTSLDELDAEINQENAVVGAAEQPASGSPEPVPGGAADATVPVTDTTAPTAPDGVTHPDGSVAPPADDAVTTAPGPEPADQPAVISQNEQLAAGNA